MSYSLICENVRISDASVCALTFLLYAELFLNHFGDIQRYPGPENKYKNFSKFGRNVKIYALLILTFKTYPKSVCNWSLLLMNCEKMLQWVYQKVG